MKKLLYSLFFAILLIDARAQDNKLSLQFEKILFRNLADTIEKTIPVKIYYSNTCVDSLSLHINSENESLNTLLNKTIAKNGLSFIITDDNKIILSKGYTLRLISERNILNIWKRTWPEQILQNTPCLFQKPKAM